MRKFLSIILLLFLIVSPTISHAAAPFKITVSSSTLEVGESTKIKATNSGKQKITYTIGNKKILSIKSGKITAKYPGTTKVTAKAGKKTSSVTIKVLPKVKNITLKTKEIYINQTVKLNPYITYEPSRAAVPAVSYKIANMKLAKIDQKGNITGLAEGKTKLTIQAGKMKKSFDLEVKYGEIYWTKSVDEYFDAYETTSSWSHNNLMFTINRNVYDARNGKLVKTFNDGDIDFYPEGLAKINMNGTMELYNQGIRKINEFAYDPDMYMGGSSPRRGDYSRRYTSDGNVIFNEYYDTIMVNLESGEIEQIYEKDNYGFGQYVLLEVTPDENTVAIASENDIYLFNRESGNLENTYSVDSDGVSGLAFSMDGKYMTVLHGDYGDDNTIVDVINLETSLADYTLTEHTDKVTDLAYSPNGKYLATSSVDGTIQIYETSSYTNTRSLVTSYNKRMIKLRRDPTEVWQISFSPDGEKLLALFETRLSDEPEIVLWNTRELK
ncbi:Ig-like domain-containing protein [Bacillus massilinigeriensis]|uniref:Ig-like domain-containing protein n=1 Tax=Bacillus massilionigeriensis TaxID=1805475 RepID=UPI00096B283B|nr:Ig-like domain-containing protein [Bacillus massilionigeriensis]